MGAGPNPEPAPGIGSRPQKQRKQGPSLYDFHKTGSPPSTPAWFPFCLSASSPLAPPTFLPAFFHVPGIWRLLSPLAACLPACPRDGTWWPRAAALRAPASSPHFWILLPPPVSSLLESFPRTRLLAKRGRRAPQAGRQPVSRSHSIQVRPAPRRRIRLPPTSPKPQAPRPTQSSHPAHCSVRGLRL